jgi:hypothetical protein
MTYLRQYIGGTIIYFLNMQGGSNLQDEYSQIVRTKPPPPKKKNIHTIEILLIFGGSPGITYSKSQLDATIYWRSYS